ncbi:MAG: glutathione S-transferase family protein [Gammaproteobacteria bacterium]|nr:MAG: glutathione S-transferase family protein [Gammaproteobacteria bacterium]TDJ42715.1 MAG: glutathione S-transferase family protein [Gammaproteobacteria bacterium]
MKLYTAKGTPNGRRVEIFLAEKHVDLPSVQVDLRGGENITPEFRRMNPMGRIPVLEMEDGSFISESVAICRYFESLHPEPCLFGRGAEQQAIIEMWGRRAELNFLLNAATAFRNLTGFFKDRETINKDWGQTSLEVAQNALPIFDAHLASAMYLAGDEFSIADITFGAGLDFTQAVKLDLPFDLVNLVSYRARLAERPSFQN